MASNKTKKYTVALIGAGWSGLASQMDELRIKPASHAEAVSMCRNSILAALVDTDTQALKVARRLYPEVPQFSDAQSMLEHIKPDIAIIATPPDTHCRYIELLCASDVKAILCEKPISHNLAEALKAVATARKRGTHLFINHIRRFDPLVRRFKEYVTGAYVRDTYLGAIRSASAFYNKGLYHGGTHYIDLLCFFLGDAEWVSALSRKEVLSEGDVIADCTIGFASGAVATLHYFDSSTYVLSEVSLFGERGRLDLKHNAGLLIESIGTRSYPDISGYRELDYGSKRSYGTPRSYFAPQIPHIIDCLEGKDTPVSTGEDAVKVLRVIQAAEKSIRMSGRKVLL